MLRRRSDIIWLFPSLAVMGLATAAHAQNVTPQDPVAPQDAVETDSGLGDIVVTAQKRSERLQDVPIAVTAVSGAALAAKGVSSVLDVLTVVPGLNYTQVTGSASPRIRGIGTANALSNENSVSTYVDGVYYASPSSTVLSLNNIEQVAVLKGPQGTLFGRNATGGLIQITTRDPQTTFSGDASVGYGNNDTINATLYVTGGLAPNLAADFAVYYHNQQDGFGTNLSTGNETNKSKELSLRSKIKLEAGDNDNFTLSLDYSRLRAAMPGRRPASYSLPSAGPRFTGGKFDIYSPIDPFYHNWAAGVSLTERHNFGGADLVSITAYRQSDSTIFISLDGTTILNNTALSHFPDKQFTQELQLVSTGNDRFSWNLGVYYFLLRNGYYDIDFQIPPNSQFFNTRQKTQSIAGYAQATYKVADSTSVTAGIRYTYEKKDFSGEGTITPRATGVTTMPPPVADKLRFERPTWRLSVDHHFNTDILGYVSYNRGFKSGGFNATIFNAIQRVNPETLDAYEVGLKSDLFDRKLRINTAVFYYNYKNLQLTTLVNGLPVQSNGPKAKIYGLDLDATARPVRNLTLSAGLSLIHSRFGSFLNAPLSIPLAAGGNRQTSGDATGNELPQAPDWTANVGADWEVPLQSGKIILSTHYFHSDGWFSEADNRIRQKPYDLLSGSIKWDIGDSGKFSLTAWGKNLTNEAYATQFVSAARTDVLTVVAGRSYGLTAGVKF